jgi:microcystin degradation protein MlrC
MPGFRVAVGGFMHETNTFAPTRAGLDAFEHGGGWPKLSRGPALIEATRNVNMGICGFIGEAETLSWEIVPTLWCAASPSAHVTRDAFEAIAGEILAGLGAAGRLDGVYLDLHGAMVAEHLDDGEGELLARVRELIGPSVPLVASLDLHANVTPKMVENADVLVAYRTYPHVDMADTGRRAAQALGQLIDSGERWCKAFRQLPFLIPISWQCTGLEPACSIFAHLAELEGTAVPTLSFAPGFPAADFADCGPAVIAYGRTQGDANRAADTLARRVCESESAFAGTVYEADDGVRKAMAIARTATKPVVIADTQDNPGAGGNSDTTGMLRALLAAGATRSALGVLVDPLAARAAHEAGEGAEIAIALGGCSGIPGDAPFEGRFTVETLASGQLVATGPFYGGSRIDLGASACLRIDGVRIVVASRKAQMADQQMYRFVGIEPTEQSILVNKSSVHFRADFEPIAAAILICAAPGPMPADPATLPWRHLRPGLRLKPDGPVFHPTPITDTSEVAP